MGLGQPYRILTVMARKGSSAIRRVRTALMPGDQENISSWLHINDDGDIADYKTNVSVPETTGISCLVSAGSDYIGIGDLAGTELVTHDGTASFVVASGIITFGAGTIYNLNIDGLGFFPCEEGADLPLDVSGGDTAVLDMSTTWGSTVRESYSRREGFTPAVYNPGEQWIDLGILPTEFTKIEIMVENLNFDALPIGARTNTTDLIIQSNIGIIKCQFGTSALVDSGVTNLGTHIISVDKDYLTVDGQQTPISAYTWPDTPANNIYMFTFNDSGSPVLPAQFTEMTIYYVKIWESGVLVRDMVPYGNGTFIDLVNDVVYSNENTGTLIDKSVPALANGESYTEWLVAEDAKGLSNGSHSTTQVYVAATAGGARTNLLSRGYTLTDGGSV
jgi:hypothetical protein